MCRFASKILGEMIRVLATEHGVKPGSSLQNIFLWGLELGYESWSADWIFKLSHPCIIHDIKGLALQGKAACYRASWGNGTAKADFEWLRCSVKTSLQAPSPTAILIGHSLTEVFRKFMEKVRLIDSGQTSLRSALPAQNADQVAVSYLLLTILPLGGKKRRSNICCGLLVLI